MKLIIFDVDGTLVDSQHGIVEAQARAFAKFGLAAPSRAKALSVVGLSLTEAFVALVGPDGPVHGLTEAYKAAWTDLRSTSDAADLLYPGAAEAIAALRQLPGLRLGIATGKSRPGVDRLIATQGWSHVFATIQTADRHPSKPHPSMLFAAMADVGTQPDETTMVGDTTYDIEMAVAAGVRPIGVAWGYHHPDALVAAGAQKIVESFGALQAALSLDPIAAV